MKELIKSISKKEWLFVMIIGVIYSFIIFSPTLYAILITPAGYQFTGLKVPNPGDYMVFYSRIEQSLQGYFFHQYLYSAESMPRVLFFPIWTLMGLVGRVLSLTSQQTLYFFQIILIPILVISLYLLISQFIKEIFWRKITLLILLLTTGNDWPFWPFFKKWFNWLGMDLNLPDSHIITAVQNTHLIFFLIFICWLVMYLIQLIKTKNLKYSWLMGIICLLLFLSHPFQIIPILGVVAVYLLYQIIIKKELWLIKKIIPFVAFNLISGSYLFWLWNNFPLIKNWNQQNNVLNIPDFYFSFFLISTLSIFLILAIYQIYQKIKNQQFNNYSLLIIWLIIGWLVLYLPIQWRGKMLLGLSIPISILGSLGLKNIWSKIKFSWQKAIIGWGIIILTLPSGFYLVGHNFYLYWQSSQLEISEYYFPDELVDSLRWLKNLPINSVILAPLYYGIVIPAYAGRKVYVGHGYETMNYREKFFEATKFFNNRQNDNFLEKNKIDYIFTTASLNNFPKDNLQLIFENSLVKVYQVIN